MFPLRFPEPYKALQPLRNDGIFICIDTETAENYSGLVTEIGIAIMKFHPPGSPESSYVIPRITAQHFIIAENSSKSHRNGRFVPDHRDYFCYGTSQHAFLKDIRQVWNKHMNCIDKPIFYVGHNISTDLSALKKMDLHIPSGEILDTEKMWRAVQKEGKCSLSFLLEACQIPHAFLHNAGNDAYVNMLLFQVLCDPIARKELNIDNNFSFTSKKKHKKRFRKFPSDFPIECPKSAHELEDNINYLGSFYYKFNTSACNESVESPQNETIVEKIAEESKEISLRTTKKS